MTRSGALVVAIVAFGLACGSGGGDGSKRGKARKGKAPAPVPAASSNDEACRQYVAHVNGLACLNLNEDADDTCAGVENLPDMTEYYACLIGNMACQGKVPKVTTEGCEPPV